MATPKTKKRSKADLTLALQLCDEHSYGSSFETYPFEFLKGTVTILGIPHEGFEDQFAEECMSFCKLSLKNNVINVALMLQRQAFADGFTLQHKDYGRITPVPIEMLPEFEGYDPHALEVPSCGDVVMIRVEFSQSWQFELTKSKGSIKPGSTRTKVINPGDDVVAIQDNLWTGVFNTVYGSAEKILIASGRWTVKEEQKEAAA